MNNKKKKMIFVIIFGHIIFGLVMGWHIFGSVYINAINAEPIFLFCKIFTVTSLIVSLLTVFLFRRLGHSKLFIYVALPYVLSQLITPLISLHLGYETVKGLPMMGAIFFYLFYLYIPCFIWVLSIFMLALDCLLARIFSK